MCALNSTELVASLERAAPPGISIVGTMHTENLGIERMIRNVLANPNIRFLMLCGEDAQQAIGHLPGQSLASLFQHGTDKRGRIVGAKGKRPVLKNITQEQISAFLLQVELINRIGVHDERVLVDCIQACHERDPGPFRSGLAASDMVTIQANEPHRLVPDRAGFLVVYPDALRGVLTVEHYKNDGVLDCIIEGQTPAAVYSATIERELLTRLDHAAYLGRELALAERSMKTGERYVQDRAPGELEGEETSSAEECECSTTASRGGAAEVNEVADLLQSALTGGRLVALPLALLGGIIAGLNPCCLPLYPAAAATCCAVRGEQVKPAFWNAAAFVAGVALVTTILGVAAALSGGLLASFGSWVYYVIAVVPIAMGLHMLGWISLPLPQPGNLTARQGVLGALVAGSLFSLVLAPCGTPSLASVLSYAAYDGSVSYGGALLLVYDLGAGVPVAAAAFIAGGAATRLGQGRWQKWVNRIAGGALIAIGVYLVWAA